MRGTQVATAMATLLAMTACGSSDDGDDDTGSTSQTVKCEGINECAGQSECATSDGTSSCEGLNECAGQGWITVSPEECAQKGGTVIG